MSFFYSMKKPRTIHNRTKKNYISISKNTKMPKVIIGKIYAKWCIHCQHLDPEWKKLIKSVYSNSSNRGVIKFVSIEETNMINKMKIFYKKYGISDKIKKSFDNVKGFPTIFKIKNGNVKFYNGERMELPMKKWVLE